MGKEEEARKKGKKKKKKGKKICESYSNTPNETEHVCNPFIKMKLDFRAFILTKFASHAQAPSIPILECRKRWKSD
jgi:hypothetical protein